MRPVEQPTERFGPLQNFGLEPFCIERIEGSLKSIIHGYIRSKALVAHGEIHRPLARGRVGQNLQEFGEHICDQVFRAADGFFGEERGVHALASKSAFARRHGGVGSFYRRGVVEVTVFVKLSADLEDSGWGKLMMYVIGRGGLADCRLLCLGYGVDWGIVSLLDLKNINQQPWSDLRTIVM